MAEGESMETDASPSASPAPAPAPAPNPEEDRRSKVLADYRKVLLQHKETDGKVRQSESRLP